MNLQGDPWVIEYNVRMGDPETESVFPRIQSDLVQLLKAVAGGTLSDTVLEVDPRSAATVMLVSGGYPGSYEKGKPITGLDQVNDSLVFHAGTSRDEQNRCITAGGRVLRSEEHTSELQSLMRISYAVFCLKKKNTRQQ